MEAFHEILYGAIVGDALSIQYEPNEHPKPNPHIIINPYGFHRCWMHSGTKGFSAGQVSDNTEIMIALLKHIMPTRAYNHDSAVKSYIAWCQAKCPFMKRSMRKHFDGITTISGYDNRCKSMEFERAWTLSNESLLRCIPLVILGFRSDNDSLRCENPINDEERMLNAVKEDCKIGRAHV